MDDTRAAERLNQMYQELKSWNKLSSELGVNRGLVWKVAREGFHSPTVLRALGIEERGAMETRKLPVKLDQAQVALRADKLAQVLEQRNQKRRQLEDVKDTMKARVKDLEAEIERLDSKASDLAGVVRTHSEKQEVSVEWKRNEKPNPPLMELYRTDTGEMIDNRPMTVEERQRPFDFPKGQEEEEEVDAAS